VPGGVIRHESILSAAALELVLFPALNPLVVSWIERKYDPDSAIWVGAQHHQVLGLRCLRIDLCVVAQVVLAVRAQPDVDRRITMGRWTRSDWDIRLGR
jgi:hypothetical protein